VLRACGCLQDLEKVEADSLLDLHSGTLYAVFPDIPDTHVASAPEVIQILLLVKEKVLETLAHHAIQGPLGASAEFEIRRRGGGVINHPLGKLDHAPGTGGDHERHLPKVVRLHGLACMRTFGLQNMVDTARDAQTALSGRMAQDDAKPPAVA
jgi:hypothetical protein